MDTLLKKYLVLDTETTILNKGNPFTNENKLCYIGLKTIGNSDYRCFKVPFNVDQLQAILDSHTYLVAFNAKFDCHWLERLGINLRRIRIWDTQYAYFLLSSQQVKYPALNDVAKDCGFGEKLDVVKTEYWDKGIDTPDIPEEVINPYLEQDVNLTEQIFLYQLQALKDAGLYRLFLLHMEDQICLREMERNGILYDTKQSLEKAKDAEEQIKGIEKELFKGYEHVPINFDSTDHLSAYLYGGTITIETRIPIGFYKTGAKIGQPRYKIVEHKYELPRLVEPLPKSELKKEGLWSTDEKTLRKLRGTKEFKIRIGLLNERSRLEKLRGTYYEGFPKTIAKMSWSNDTIHSTLNQCTAITGRLSSTKPNQQNIPPECKQLCVSRYYD